MRKFLEAIIDEIFYKPNKSVPQYLEILFITNLGVYEVDIAHVKRVNDYNLKGYNKVNFIDDLKRKYGALNITDARITYDSNKYFLISGSFFLVVGYLLNSYSELSTNDVWVIEDIFQGNLEEFEEFKQLDKLEIKE